MYEAASTMVATVVPWQMLIIIGLGIALIPIGCLCFKPGYALTNANNALAPFIGVHIQFFSTCLAIMGFFLVVGEATRLFWVLGGL